MEYLIHILILVGIYAILALSLNLVVGYTGLVALGQIAFAAIGAYTSSLLALNVGLSPWLGLLAGALLAGLFGVLVSYSALRLKGDYLALATFGLGIIIYSLANNLVDLTRGPMGLSGIPPFAIFGFEISNIWTYLVLVLVFVSVTYMTIHNITSSPFGRVLQGIREDEIAVTALGQNVNRYKVIVLVVGAVFAAIAGSLYAHYISFIDPSSFTAMESISVLLMVIFGGLADLPGSILGAAVLVILPEMLRFLGMPSSVAAPLRQMIYGALLVALMIWRPQGLLGKYQLK